MNRVVAKVLKGMVYLTGRPKNMHTLFKLLDFAGFKDPFAMMDELKCDAIYETKAVSSSRTHGIKGLGTELVR